MSWNAMIRAVEVAQTNPNLSLNSRDFLRVSADDLQQIQRTIVAQLAALADGDAEAAWRLCAPRAWSHVNSALGMMRWLMMNCTPMLVATRVAFGEIDIAARGLSQRVRLVDDDNDHYDVSYIMERQPNGRWLIAGCGLMHRDGGEAAAA